jgi:hypothetical protein
VEDAKKISKSAPHLADKIRSGKMNISQAKRQMKEEAREKRREQNRKTIESVPPATAIENARFATIMIDPPWEYREDEVGNVFGRALPDYATLPLSKLLELPIAKMADIDCHLYLWITNRFLPKGFQLIDTWGFRYVTCLTWGKLSFGMGNYFRLVSRIYGLILVLGVARACDIGLFPSHRRCGIRKIVWSLLEFCC